MCALITESNMFGGMGRPSAPRFYNERPPRELQVLTSKAEAKIRDAIDPKLLARVDIMRSVELDVFIVRIRILRMDWTLHSDLHAEVRLDEVDNFPDDTLMTQIMMLAG
jgi:hypothetical protein